MKRKTMCVVALVLWFLLFSTVFSMWVERTMVPWVTTIQPTRSTHSVGNCVPLDCLSQDETGNYLLYHIMEGAGWEDGYQATLFDSRYYEVNPDEVTLNSAEDKVILFSSKPIQAGKRVNLISKAQDLPDTLLFICPEGLPPIKNGAVDACRILGQTDTVLMLSSSKVSSPFLPGKAQTDFLDWNFFENKAGNVYSMIELQKFADSICLLAFIPGLGISVFILWIYSCFLTTDIVRNKKLLVANGLFSAVALGMVFLFFRIVQLPSSLLPTRNIVELSHYKKEFCNILSGLNTLAALENQEALAFIEQMEQALIAALFIFLGVLVLCLGMVLIESVFSRRRTHNKHLPNRVSL